MGRLAHRGVVHAQVAADCSHDDIATVQPHADLYRETLNAQDLAGESLHCLLHPDRCETCTDGMVLVCNGRAEERHDSVAHDLVDSALVAMNGLHHSLEYGVEDL